VDLPLAAGLTVSLVAHATLLVPLSTRALRASGGPADLDVRLEPTALRPAPPRVTLGIDRSQHSTVTWIGYREYQEHLAPRSLVEQAAFTPTPGPGAVPEESPPPAPLALPAPSHAPAPAAALASPAPAPVPTPSPPAVPATPLVPLATPSTLAVTGPAAPAHDAPPPPAPALPVPQPPAPQPTAPQLPAPAATTAPPAGAPGDRADLESDATSLLDVPLDRIRAGRPLAARGLEIKTRRPEFTTLLRLTAAPGNPLVEIAFGPDGRPRSAVLLHGSGDVRIDDAILSSLYRWRASGEALRELAEGETADVRIRILLTQREGP
jgi:hypothetical protein